MTDEDDVRRITLSSDADPTLIRAHPTLIPRDPTLVCVHGVQQRGETRCRLVVSDIPLHQSWRRPYGQRVMIMVMVHRVRQQPPLRETIAAGAGGTEVMGLAPAL